MQRFYFATVVIVLELEHASREYHHDAASVHSMMRTPLPLTSLILWSVPLSSTLLSLTYRRLPLGANDRCPG